MSVQLQSFTKTGATCKKCRNESVFRRDVKTFWGVYRYTEVACKMPGCGYKRLYDLKNK